MKFRSSRFYTTIFYTTLTLILAFIFQGQIAEMGGMIARLTASSAIAETEESEIDQVSLLELKRKARLYDELADLVVIGTSTLPSSRLNLVAIVGRSERSPYGSAIIGAGSREKIKSGDPVYFPDGSLYGSVTSVTSHSSTVVPYSLADRKTRGYVEGKTPIILMGRGNGSFDLSAVEQASLQKGDLIYSASGHPFAEIVEVSQSDDTTLITGLARAPHSINSTRFLKVDYGYEK